MPKELLQKYDNEFHQETNNKRAQLKLIVNKKLEMRSMSCQKGEIISGKFNEYWWIQRGAMDTIRLLMIMGLASFVVVILGG